MKRGKGPCLDFIDHAALNHLGIHGRGCDFSQNDRTFRRDHKGDHHPPRQISSLRKPRFRAVASLAPILAHDESHELRIERALGLAAKVRQIVRDSLFLLLFGGFTRVGNVSLRVECITFLRRLHTPSSQPTPHTSSAFLPSSLLQSTLHILPIVRSFQDTSCQARQGPHKPKC